MNKFGVMAGLEPAIHANIAATINARWVDVSSSAPSVAFAWMAGTSPAMTF